MLTNPTHSDIQALAKGDRIKVNGRQVYTVCDSYPNFISIRGARGGWANLVPSTSGLRVEVTTLHARTWIDTLEVL